MYPYRVLYICDIIMKKLVRFDWAIKKLLRNKANFVILEGFLSELLFDDIKINQILESESNQDYEEGKYNRVDILTQNSKDELIIIEIQNNYEIDYFQRMSYGVSKSISENLDSGKKYANVKKVISVNIVYFDLGQGNDYIYKGKTEFRGFHQNDILQLSANQKAKFAKTDVSDIFPEFYLLKVNKFDGDAKDTLDEWIYFLKNSAVQDDFKAKGLREASNALDIMKLSKDDTFIYNRHCDSLSLKESELYSLQDEAENRVRLDERNKTNIVTAKNGIEAGFDNDTIQKITKLTFEEIELIRKELKN
jgi:predicted transposase/invertase (TIGR01784 family)